MSSNAVFDAIRPGLTFYSILLTFAILAFTLGKYFWEFEKTLISDTVDKLRALLDGQRRRFVEPILARELGAAIDKAYDNAIFGLIGDLYENSADQGQLPENELRAAASEASLKERLEKLKRSDDFIEKLFFSPAGSRLYEDLEYAYTGAWTLWAKYQRAREGCWRASYAFFSLFVLMLIGLLQLIAAWDSLVTHLWVFTSVLTLLFAMYSFVRLEMFRRQLLRLWEDLQLHGKF